MTTKQSPRINTLVVAVFFQKLEKMNGVEARVRACSGSYRVCK